MCIKEIKQNNIKDKNLLEDETGEVGSVLSGPNEEKENTPSEQVDKPKRKRKGRKAKTDETPLPNDLEGNVTSQLVEEAKVPPLLEASDDKTTSKTERVIKDNYDDNDPCSEDRINMVVSLLDKGFIIKDKKGIDHAQISKTLKTLEQAENFEDVCLKKGVAPCYDVGLKPNGDHSKGFTCIDIDHQWAWDRVMNFIEMYPDVIINPTIRGGHLIFSSNPIYRKTIQKATLNLGIKADHLTNTVRVIAPGKFITHLPKGDLSEISYILCPTNPSTKEPLLKEGVVEEGSRNSRLHTWCNYKIEGTRESRTIP